MKRINSQALLYAFLLNNEDFFENNKLIQFMDYLRKFAMVN